VGDQFDAQSNTAVEAVFERQLSEILAHCHNGLLAGLPAPLPTIAVAAIAVAYSGGLDSSALLHLAHAYARKHGLQIFAFHIHHGLSPHADAWLGHCAAAAAQLGVGFEARRVTLERRDKTGIEEAARLKRYAALGELCRSYQAPILLTAHHQDDQAETVLLQLLRGSGVAGLSGMDRYNRAPDLLGSPDLVMARPLLGMARADLEWFVAARGCAYVEDESNADPRYARNALRQLVLPTLAQHFPGFPQRFARSAQHVQSAQRLLIELAAEDLAVCGDGDCLGLPQLRQLSADRCNNLLRYWFGTRGLRMPSTAWLDQLRSQLFAARDDAQLCVTHPDCHIQRYRDRVHIVTRLAADALEVPPQAFCWNGEAQMRFDDFRGVLHFDPAKQGFDVNWLRAQGMQMAYRSGGERLKLAANRPTKSMKYHYQAFDVPPWERERLPLVFMVDSVAGSPLTGQRRLLYAAGIGAESQFLSRADSAQARISLRWQADVAGQVVKPDFPN
jgi:tRNA(Ile)-lysidine synthase